MYKRFYVLVLFFVIMSSLELSAAVQTRIESYDSTFDFAGKKIVYIRKGDRSGYKDTDFDDSEWKLISLPSRWQKWFPGYTGICWYRIHFLFPEQLPRHPLGISLGTISDADEVYFNGSLIGHSGSFGPERVSAYDKKRIYDIPTQLIVPGGDNVIAIRVSGLFKMEGGPYKGGYCIGPYLDLLQHYFAHELFDGIFIFLYIIIGCYFLFHYMSRYIDKEYLFFALFTLSAAIYMFLRTDLKYFLTDNFILLKRTEYITLFTILFFMMEYITYFFKRKNILVHYIYLGITFLSIVPVLLTSDPETWNKVLIYGVEPAWSIPIVYSVYVSVKDVKKQQYGIYILLCFPFVWLSFFNDVLVSNYVLNSVPVSQYAFIVVIVGTAIVMKKRYLGLFKELEGFKARSRWKPVVTEESKKKIEEVIRYLEENYTYDISREGIAETLDIHHDYLGKLFKQYKGMKIGDYINELRIKKATQMLLEDTEKSVTDIAFDVGYESLSTFYRVFQNIMEMSPTDYREQNNPQNGEKKE